MKKVFLFILALIFTLPMAAQTRGMVKREGGYTNVRSGPGTNYRIVKTASSGEEYDVYDVSEDGTYTWYQIDEDQWVADANGGMVTYVEK